MPCGALLTQEQVPWWVCALPEGHDGNHVAVHGGEWPQEEML